MNKKDERTTGKLIEISRSYLFKGSENSTTAHEWGLCVRLQEQLDEVKILKEALDQYSDIKRWSGEGMYKRDFYSPNENGFEIAENALKEMR